MTKDFAAQQPNNNYADDVDVDNYGKVQLINLGEMEEHCKSFSKAQNETEIDLLDRYQKNRQYLEI